MKIYAALATAFVLLSLTGRAPAQIAVSGNDGKQVHPDDVPPGMRQDTISTINLSVYPPKLLATIDGHASMIGPPKAVAVAPDSSFAIVTCSQKPDPNDPTKLVLSDFVSVVDLANPSKPKVLQVASAGPGAEGVSINATATMALVANTSGSVSVFTISHKKLTKVGDVTVEEGSGPTDVDFSKDGKLAYVVERAGGRITILNVDGTNVTMSGKSFVTGASPYGMSIGPDGTWAVNTNSGADFTLNPPPRPQAMRGEGGEGGTRGAGRGAGGGGSQTIGTITLVDLTTNKILDSAMVGHPEHVALSPDGKYVEVTVANGAASLESAPNFGTTHGIIRVYGIADGKLTEIANTYSGHSCQGATWSNDDKVILLQCSTERDIEVYRFNGKSLMQDTSATMYFNNRPGAIVTAKSQ